MLEHKCSTTFCIVSEPARKKVSGYFDVVYSVPLHSRLLGKRTAQQAHAADATWSLSRVHSGVFALLLICLQNPGAYDSSLRVCKSFFITTDGR